MKKGADQLDTTNLFDFHINLACISFLHISQYHFNRFINVYLFKFENFKWFAISKIRNQINSAFEFFVEPTTHIGIF